MGRLIADRDHIAAQNEIRERLGGYEAMLAPSKVTSRMKGQENILGYAIGARECEGKPTGDLALKVFVRKKVPRERIEANARVPREVAGIATDVEEIKPVKALSGGLSNGLPTPCAVSIANQNGIEVGTLGFLIETGGAECLISCNHVIANLNVCNVGDTINLLDQGAGTSVPVAKLKSWGIISFGNTPNVVDVAVADVINQSVLHQLLGMPLQTPARQAAVFDNVRKSGFKTRVTFAYVDSVNAEIPVEMKGVVNGNVVKKIALFQKQIRVRTMGTPPFCDSGDSGSVVTIVGSDQPVGMLFAGNESSGYFVNPITALINTMLITDIFALAQA